MHTTDQQHDRFWNREDHANRMASDTIMVGRLLWNAMQSMTGFAICCICIMMQVCQVMYIA